MSFIDCILNNPNLRPSQKNALVSDYNDLFERYRVTMGEDAGAAAAAQKYMEIQQSVLTKKNVNMKKDVLAWDSLNRKVDVIAQSYASDKERAGKVIGKLYGKSPEAAAVRSVLENIFTRQQALQRKAELGLSDIVEKYRSKFAGLTQDVEGFKGIVRGVLDGTGEGKVLREIFDAMHRMYESAGGVIGKIDNYFPQTHNPELVGRSSFEQWRDTIRPLLDVNKMTDPDTGLPFTETRLAGALKDIYDGIRTNGLNEVAERAKAGKQTFGKGGGPAQRHSSSRFLHFKNADAYFQYNAQFGYGDSGLFDAMMGHIHTMTRDIALLQELGPNPNGQMSRLTMKLQGAGAETQAIKTVEGMYSVLSGRTSFNGQLPGWYLTMSNIQNLLRSSLLGGAPISAMSDSFFGAFTAKMNGVPAAKFMGQYFSLLNPANVSDRRMARRIGFVAGAASGSSLTHAKFMDETQGRGVFGWLASFTNRASGLGIMTDSLRQATVLSTQGFLAEAKAMNMAWDEIDTAMKEAFGRWNMDQKDYDNIMRSEAYIDPDSESDFIRPEDVALVDVDTATKYDLWLTDMAQQASNEPRLLTRAIATGAIFGDAREGTILRATASSLMMFKSFGITVLLNHMIPALRHMGTARGMDRFSRIVPIVMGTTILGGAAMQARDVLYGKTPRDMDGKFWAAAMMQGGGFGIFGDFLFSDQSRFGQDIFKTMAGPMVGFATDAYKVFKGNFDKALDDDKEAHFMADLFQFSKRYIPGVKLWYTRLLLERLMLDQAERAIDPNFDNRMRRLENKRKQEAGQRSWWKPGKTVPE